MKRILVCALAALMTIAAFGQTKKIPQRLEISQVEVNDGAVELEVFVMPVGEEKHYYLSVGTVGTTSSSSTSTRYPNSSSILATPWPRPSSPSSR